MSENILELDFGHLTQAELIHLIHKPSHTITNFEKEIIDFIDQWFDEKDYILVHTSGSTGKPKEIKLSKKAMQLSAERTLQFFDIQSGDSALLALPNRYIAGKMMLVRALIGKMKLIATEPHIKIKLPEKKIDFAAFIPLQIEYLLNNNTDFKQFKNIIIGGAAIPFDLKERLKNLPARFFATYGMTETITHIALQRLNGKNTQNYFQCLPDIEVYADEKNCLCIKTPYFKQTIITNDCVEIMAEDKFRLLGRIDNVVNSGGLKIQPEEIETILAGKIKAPFFVAGISDSSLGKKLALFIEGEQNIRNEKEFKKYMQNLLERNKIPKEIYWIPHFTYTETMKINRKKCLENAKL